MINSKLAIILGGLISMGSVPAAVVYDEQADGDLSGNYLDPTRFTLALGSNELLASVGASPFDRDIFTVSIPPGLQVKEIRILEFSGAGGVSFMGVQPGSRLSHSPNDFIDSGNGAPFPVDPINYVLFGASDASTDRDVLPQLVVGQPIGGQNPLAEGEYAFWLNETRSSSSFTIDFVAVPEPSVAALGLLGAVGLLRRRRD